MGRKSGGEWWVEARRAEKTIDGAVSGPMLTAALMNARSTLSLAMARRLSSAYLYTVSKTDDDVRASIAVCEQLQTIERLDPSAISDVVGPALAGHVPLSALQELAASIRARLSAVSADTLTPVDLVHLCPEWQERELGKHHIEFDQIRDSDDVVVDAALYFIAATPLADGWDVEYHARWCMLVSPHVKCAKIKDSSHDKFIARIRIALSLYDRVSVICSSSYEHELVEERLRRPQVWHRVWLRNLDGKSGRGR